MSPHNHIESVVDYDRKKRKVKVLCKKTNRSKHLWLDLHELPTELRRWTETRFLCSTTEGPEPMVYENRNKILERMWLTFQRSQGRALILDTPALKTTRMLLQHNLQVYLPNPIDYDDIRKEVQKLRYTERRNVNIYKLSLHHAIQEYDQQPNQTPFDFVYADYCCPWQGNAWCTPSEDLKLLFEKKLLAPDALLAVTASYRTFSKLDKPGHQGVELIADICRLAYSYGIVALPMEQPIVYGRKVFMAMFRCRS